MADYRENLDAFIDGLNIEDPDMFSPKSILSRHNKDKDKKSASKKISRRGSVLVEGGDGAGDGEGAEAQVQPGRKSKNITRGHRSRSKLLGSDGEGASDSSDFFSSISSVSSSGS